MIWWVVIALAALYLLIRFVQMGHFFVTRFLLAPAIPLPVKVAVLLVMGGTVLATWLWWKRSSRGSRASRREA